MKCKRHLYKRVCLSVGLLVGRSITRFFLMMRKWPKLCNKLGKVCDASLGNSRQLWAILGQLLGNSGTHLWANSWATLGQLWDASMGQLLALSSHLLHAKKWPIAPGLLTYHPTTLPPYHPTTTYQNYFPEVSTFLIP